MSTRSAERALLSVRELSKTYEPPRSFWSRSNRRSPIPALRGASFDVQKGELIGVIGESGCGKTTLARSMLRLTEPTSGEVWFRGTDLLSLPHDQLRTQIRPYLRMIFQHPEAILNPGSRVGAVLERAVEIHSANGVAGNLASTSELLDQVGLPVRTADRYPDELSGGERRRIGICRALATRPELIIADEPLSGLDVLLQERILRLLLGVQAEHGFSLIIISHDLERVFQVCSKAIVMFKGRIVEEVSSRASWEGQVGGNRFDFVHPYSKLLLASRVATLAKVGARFRSRSEEPAYQKEDSSEVERHPADFPEDRGKVLRGCAVRAICSLFSAKGRPLTCENDSPPLKILEDDHRVACHFQSELNSS